MLEVVGSAKILVCVGSGGVGKTTIAAALGALAAAQNKSVLVLTIDPSQRLKTTLGLPENGDIIEIANTEFGSGHLFAAVINAKTTFDQFIQATVTKAGMPADRAEKIFRNKLYQQLSTTLSGSQEFTALEKLYSSVESKKYDLIILDTPPTKHAMDFLAAPEKLSFMFNDRVTKWLRSSETKSWITEILNAGTRQVLNVLESLTGSEFTRELQDFFVQLDGWQGRLEERIAAVHRLLVSRDTQFVLVTSFDEAKLQEAEFFNREIRKAGYSLNAVIMNRAYPLWLEHPVKLDSASSPLAALYEKMRLFSESRELSFRSFTQKMENFCRVYKLPEMEDDISNISGVLALKKQMEICK